MTVIAISGHRLAKRAALLEAATRPQFTLAVADDEWLHESGTALTYNRAYRWRGNRDQMRTILEEVPERLRKKLRAIPLETIRPAGRAR